jgi:hypothetical protein
VSAAQHATDANVEALRLSLALKDMCDRALLGELPTHSELGALLLKSRCVQYHTARAVHATSLFPVVDRRELAVAIPAMAQEACHAL